MRDKAAANLQAAGEVLVCRHAIPSARTHLLSLALHALGGEVLGPRHKPDLARHVQRVAGADRLAVRAKRRWRPVERCV
jgi:hypothetical protein